LLKNWTICKSKGKNASFGTLIVLILFMKKPLRLFIIFFLILTSPAFSQNLKKADRIIAENFQSHINYLSDERLKSRMASQEGVSQAEEYIIGQFKKTGYKPMGDSSSWLQKFNIPDGREITAASHLSINGKELVLHADYFPFAFSASKKAEASVAMDLAENGVPWFADLKELLDKEPGTKARDTSVLISEKATRAAAKGATAGKASIPVVYITKTALKKYLAKESSSMDIRLNVEMKDRIRNGYNVIGYSDNKADSTVITMAHLDEEKDVAALLELSRLLKSRQYRALNYLFIIYSGERKDANGIKYFNDHPAINLQKVNYSIHLDMIENKGLPAVKQSIEAINVLRIHEIKTRHR
jgi:aminopeptidase YwaD